MVREGCDDEGESETLTWENLNLPLPTLKREEGKHKPKNVWLPEAGKDKKANFSYAHPERNLALPTPQF